MQTPLLFQAVDLHTHVKVGSLYTESAPIHPVQLVAFVHPVHVLLQAKLSYHKFLFNKYYKLIKNFHKILNLLEHVPPLFHAVDLQTHIYVTSL